MKKVCKNCNAVVEDDAIFCVNCGSEEIMEIEEAQPTCQAGKKCNKKLCTVFGIIGIVILAIILVLAFIGKEPYDDAIKLYENILNGEVDGIEKLAPEEIWTMLGDDADHMLHLLIIHTDEDGGVSGAQKSAGGGKLGHLIAGFGQLLHNHGGIVPVDDGHYHFHSEFSHLPRVRGPAVASPGRGFSERRHVLVYSI